MACGLRLFDPALNKFQYSFGNVFRSGLTLDDGQEDDNDEEEEGDVKKDSVELVGVTGWILNLIPNAPSCSHPDVHVE